MSCKHNVHVNSQCDECDAPELRRDLAEADRENDRLRTKVKELTARLEQYESVGSCIHCVRTGDLKDDVKRLREALLACAPAAEQAQLPPHYQWGHDAMEQFEVGKEIASDAVRAVVRDALRDLIVRDAVQRSGDDHE